MTDHRFYGPRTPSNRQAFQPLLRLAEDNETSLRVIFDVWETDRGDTMKKISMQITTMLIIMSKIIYHVELRYMVNQMIELRLSGSEHLNNGIALVLVTRCC